MDENVEFDEFGVELAEQYAKEYIGDHLSNELGVVIKTAFKNKRYLPKLGYKKGSKIIFKKYVTKWIDQYFKGYNNRPSVRKGNKSTTFPDQLSEIILKSRIKNLKEEDISIRVSGHSILMTIENIVGDLLEEYLSIKLKDSEYYCCWGSTIDAVDFCSTNGDLLQIKNSDNSENSSSSRVRSGTEIKKWFRRKSQKTNIFKWDELNKMLNRKDLSEEDFRLFVVNTINKNPECIYLDKT